jgi:hypothetical protein
MHPTERNSPGRPGAAHRGLTRPAAAAEVGAILPASLELLRAHPDWRRSWSHIVAGAFSATSPYSGLLFYAQAEGLAEFYESDGAGGIALLSSQTFWRTSWTHLVPLLVKVNGAAGSGLLLYDQAAGFGAFYATDGQGNLTLLSTDATWRDSWTLIVAGHFTDSEFSDLLFYDQANGVGALYTTNGSGAMDLVAEHDDWRTSWTHVLVQRFRSVGGLHAGAPVKGRHDVLFYEGWRAPLFVSRFTLQLGSTRERGRRAGRGGGSRTRTVVLTEPGRDVVGGDRARDAASRGCNGRRRRVGRVRGGGG